MKKVAILGPGLLGGSIALALRARLPECCVAIWARRPEAVAEVQAAGVADTASTELAPIVEGADLVVFCVPIGAMPALASEMLPLIGPKALITDVGSVKGPVVEALTPIFSQRGRFVGSHPMAGSEQSGLAAARADLFEGSVCILTPQAEASPQTTEATEELGRFWRLLGCDVRLLSPSEHDSTIGLVSHLPHLIAAVLVDFICAENPSSVNFCGNGLRDTTRVASGPAAMWTEILGTNRAVLHAQLERLLLRLQDVSQNLALGNDFEINKLLANAKEQRDRIKLGT